MSLVNAIFWLSVRYIKRSYSLKLNSTTFPSTFTGFLNDNFCFLILTLHLSIYSQLIQQSVYLWLPIKKEHQSLKATTNIYIHLRANIYIARLQSHYIETGISVRRDCNLSMVRFESHFAEIIWYWDAMSLILYAMPATRHIGLIFILLPPPLQSTSFFSARPP